ncbi:MAG: hypothetical protein ACI9P5_003656 [Saprospiraceae bacterium]
MFPSEVLLIEVLLQADTILSMNVVRENLNPHNTIELSFEQEDNNDTASLMMLKVKNPFNKILSFDAYIFALSNSEWTQTSIIPVQPNTSGFEIWYDPIANLVLENWKFSPLDRKTTVDSNTKNEREESYHPEKTNEWLKRNDIRLNELPLAPADEINYACDSTLYLKQISGDTITYWTYGWRTPIDTIKAIEWKENSSYGISSYFKKVNYNGTLTSVNLIPRAYFIRNDSIMEEQKFYHISNDSLSSLYRLAYSTNDSKKRKHYEDIIQNNSFNKFKLIYHPGIFVNNIYEGNYNNDKITLIDRWKCRDRKYFAIEISNYRSNGEVYKYTLVFDENHNWLEYDGCDKIGIECMKKREFKVHYR